MQSIDMNLNKTKIRTAKYKLSQHRIEGEKSGLSVFQVAQLMDTLQGRNSMQHHGQNLIFFSLN